MRAKPHPRRVFMQQRRGTTLLARADLERAGGWRAVRRHVDEALIEDIVRIGGGNSRRTGRRRLQAAVCACIFMTAPV